MREEPSAGRRARLSVVIPAYNEEERLPATLDAVGAYLARQSYTSEVLVVDDGSTDRTAEIVHRRAGSNLSPVLVQHPDRRNRGKGAAVCRGMLAAAGDYRLFMDADGAIAIDHLDAFWPFFDAGYEVVIGCKDNRAIAARPLYSWHRRMVAKAGAAMIRALATPEFGDTQTGFKAFTRDAAMDIFPRLTIAGWGFDIEVLAICRGTGRRVRAVPVKAHNRDGSKVKLKTYLEVLGELWRVGRNLRAGMYEAGRLPDPESAKLLARPVPRP